MLFWRNVFKGNNTYDVIGTTHFRGTFVEIGVTFSL